MIIAGPFLLMIVVNELSRANLKDVSYSYGEVIAMNSGDYQDDRCTWACHNSTLGHCIPRHTRIIVKGFPFYDLIDETYWGIINFNKRNLSRGAVSDHKYYASKSVICLVLIWPLIMYLLLFNYLRLRHGARSQVL